MTDRRRRADLCALRFDLAAAQAEHAVQRVATQRIERRLLLREAGLSTEAVDEKMKAEASAVLDVLPQFSQWPMRPAHWGSRWRTPDYAKALQRMAPIVRAVVWELWRDYEEWPDWRDVSLRIMTWLDVDFQEASDLAGDFGRHSESAGTGLIVEHPYHLRPPNRRRSDSGRHLWRIASYDEMLHQERLYQWRFVLGDDGFRYRTAATLILDDFPGMKVPG